MANLTEFKSWLAGNADARVSAVMGDVIANMETLTAQLETAQNERNQFKVDWLACLDLAEEAKPIIDKQRAEIVALSENYNSTTALSSELRREIEKLRATLASTGEELNRLRSLADKFEDGIDWIQRALQAEAELESLKARAS